MENPKLNGENLLTPAEVAAVFRVDPKTVTRWAKAGKIGSIRTLGGHRRFHEAEILQLLHAGAAKESPTQASDAGSAGSQDDEVAVSPVAGKLPSARRAVEGDQ